ncbi:MAG: hypothetical protein ACREBE_24005, partial [bacterium]
IALADPDAAFLTLVLLYGIRDHAVSLWQAFVGTLATDDPVLIFSGFGDESQFDDASVTFGTSWQSSARQEAPRERIGPSIGVNFTAVPNSTFSWSGQLIRIAPRD